MERFAEATDRREGVEDLPLPEPKAPRRFARLPYFALALGAVMLIGVARGVAATTHAFYSWGDQAVIELQVRSASHFQALLGPYDRYGWHHLGPAYFYLMSPLYVLTGDQSPALSGAQLLINGILAVATVAVIHRYFGWRVGAWAAGLVSVILLTYGHMYLTYPWNPFVLATAVLLTMTLAALGATGEVAPLVWAFVAASLAVQTDVSAGLVLVVVLGVGVVGFAIAFRRDKGNRPAGYWRSPLALAGIGVFLLMWVPPAVQTVTHFPGNIATVAHFFLGSHPGQGHSLHEALSTVVRQLSLRDLNPNAQGAQPPAGSVGKLIAVVDVLDAAAVCIAGLVLRRRAVLALGVVSAASMAAAVVSVFRLIGPVLPYLVSWIAMVAVPAWIGTGVLLGELARRGEAPRYRRPALPKIGSGVLAVAAAVPLALLGLELGSGSAVGYPSFTTVPALTSSIEQTLHGLHSGTILVRMLEPSCYPEGAALIDQLVKDGWDVHVDSAWVNTFGPSFAANGKETATVAIADSSDPQAPTPPPAAVGVTRSPGNAVPLRVWVVPGTPVAK